MTVTVLPAGDTTYTTTTDVAFGDTLQFPPNSTATLYMDNVNLVIHGTLEMHPANANIIHRIQFINVNEQAYVGAPAPHGATFVGDTSWQTPGTNMGSMTASATDIGLWVFDQGILDAIGTERAGWNRTGTDSTWLSTDDIRSVPFRAGNYLTFNDHYRNGVLGYYEKFDPLTDTLQFVVGPDGVTYRQEVFNLTRNVIIGGTSGHRAHCLIMTPDVTQTVKYVRFEFLGPRHINSDGSTTIVRGRWAGLHFHHLMGSVGTLAEGCVVTEGTGHAYVVHDSDDVVLRDCIAYHTADDGYWWDNEFVLNGNHIPALSNSDYSLAVDQASANVTYDHCMAAWIYMPPKDTGTAAGLSCFLLEAGPGGNAFDCVAVGLQGYSSAAGFTWPERAQSVWINSGNISHNNAGRGVYIWQNTGAAHQIHGLVAFRNSQGGITQGAYDNNYHFFDCVAFQNGGSGDVSTDFINAAAGGSIASPNWNQLIQNCSFGDYGVVHHVVNTPGAKVIVKECHLGSFRIDENRGSGSIFKHGDFDYIACDLQEPEQFCNQTVHPHAGNHTWIYAYNASTSGDSGQSILRVQRSDGTAYRMQQVGASFTDWTAVTVPSIWFYITTGSFPAATPGVAYSQPIGTIWGATNYLPFTYRLKAGSGPLPPGLALSGVGATDGLLSGTPTTAGTYPVTLEIANAHGMTSLPKNFVITVGTVASLNITTTSLPFGYVGVSYSQTLTSTGGTGVGKVWSLVSGTIPSGLGLSSGGVISGTPTTVQNPSFTVRVTDNGANTDTQLLQISITTVNPTITTTTPLPTGAIDIAYDDGQLAATGGTPPYTWSVVSGTLPAGLTLGSSTGLISGTPSAAVVSTFTVRCTNATAGSVDKALGLTIVTGVSFLSFTPIPGAVGMSYSFTYVAQNGVPPYTFTVGDNLDLPVGLLLSLDGVLSGVPTVPGVYGIQVLVVDSVGTQASIDNTLTINIRERKVRRAMALRGSSKYVSVG